MTQYPYLVRSTAQLSQHLGRVLVTLDPNEPRVSIYCAEESHVDRPWFVASWRRHEKDGRWVRANTYPMRGGVAFGIGDSYTADLVGDRVVRVADEDDVMAPYDPDFRSRYAPECGECGLRRTIRSDGALQSVCDTLWAADIRELSFSSFAARMTKSKC